MRRFWERDDASRLNPGHMGRISEILSVLAAARKPSDADLVGYRLHSLTGNRRGFWSIRVSANWRITFRFDSGEAVDIDLEDYH